MLYSRTAKLILYIAALMSVLGSAGIGQTIGVVLKKNGSWEAAGRRLAIGSRIEGGATVRNISGARSDSITILGRDGNILAEQRCGSDDCGSGISLPRTLRADAANSYFSQVWEGLSGWLFGGVKRYDSALTRGDNLSESIVRRTDGKTDLRTALHLLPSGTYDLVFDPVPHRLVERNSHRRGRPADKRKTVEAHLKWDENDMDEKAGTIAGLELGIYEMYDADDPQDKAWILVATGDHYEELSGKFEAIKRLAKLWNDKGVDKVITRRLFRSYFEFLSNEHPSAAKPRSDR